MAEQRFRGTSVYTELVQLSKPTQGGRLDISDLWGVALRCKSEATLRF